MNKEILASFCDRLNETTFCASRYSCEGTCPLVKFFNVVSVMETELSFDEAWDVLYGEDKCGQ